MRARQTARAMHSTEDSQVTIERLNFEITKLNDELTCASEAHQSMLLENARLKETLAEAAKAFNTAGNSRMAELMKNGIDGVRPKTTSIKLPSSRKIAAL